MNILSSIKILMLFLVFLYFTSLNAKEIILDSVSSSLEQIIPKGWKLLEKNYGDLNNDGINDIIFVIEKTDKKNIHKHDGLGDKDINKNPRILAIYMVNKDNKFKKIAQNNKFIPLDDCPICDEPLSSLTIKENGVFKVNFHHWQNAGSWFTSRDSYVFRLENNDIYWIGYDKDIYHRGSNNMKSCSINFLTQRVKIHVTIENDNEKMNSQEIWKKFTLNKPIKLDSLKDRKIDLLSEYCSENILQW